MEFLNKKIDPRSNCQLVFFRICKVLNIKVEYDLLKDQISKHKDYPSLISISDLLGQYGFNSIAAKASFELFPRLQLPFIACVKQKDNDDIIISVIEKINKNSIYWYNPYNNKNSNISYEKFMKHYRGYIMLFEKHNDYNLNNRITFMRKDKN